MPIVVLPQTLRVQGNDTEIIIVDGSTTAEALRSLERLQPGLRGWILDESGRLRPHVALFVDSRQVDLEQQISSDDEIYVVQAISGGGDDAEVANELLVGTRKGLFVLSGAPGHRHEIVAREFAGQTVDYVCFDRRTETYFASLTHGQFGPHLYHSETFNGGWQEAEGLAFPADSGAVVERIWLVEPGVEDGVLWAGVAPAALFRSTDHGRTWRLNQALWDQPTRPNWGAGLGGQALHSICPWPDRPDRLAVGISAAGVWITEDGGNSWSRGVDGLVPRYLPEEARLGTLAHCVHKMLRAPLQPETLFMQFHGGVYRSDDAGRSWKDIGTESGLPADFGFPLAIDPHNPDRAFVIPLIADVDRVTPDGRLRVYRTSDRGVSWQPLATGLPQKGVYSTILRQAFCQDGRSPIGLWFGTKSGEVFGSIDGGDRWFSVADHLPTIVAVQPGR